MEPTTNAEASCVAETTGSPLATSALETRPPAAMEGEGETPNADPPAGPVKKKLGRPRKNLEAESAPPAVKEKKKLGRPKGSKNKPKDDLATAAAKRQKKDTPEAPKAQACAKPKGPARKTKPAAPKKESPPKKNPPEPAPKEKAHTQKQTAVGTKSMAGNKRKGSAATRAPA